MHGRGNERPGPVARCIFVLITIVAIATVAIGIYAMRHEPASVRGKQMLPAQAAERAGQSPGPTAQPD